MINRRAYTEQSQVDAIECVPVSYAVGCKAKNGEGSSKLKDSQNEEGFGQHQDVSSTRSHDV